MRLLLISITAAALCFSGLIYAEVAPKSFQQVLSRATLVPSQTLRYGSASPQYIELFLPDSDSPAPLVVFVHGGCWLNSFSVEHARGLAEGLVAEGFAVAALEYSRLDDEGGGWPGTLNDVVAAINFLSAKTQNQYQADNMLLVGHSAGGHLALLAAHEQFALPVKGVLGLAAITDIVNYASGDSGCQHAAGRFIASAPAGTESAQYNPVEQQLTVPVQLLLGSADSIVGQDQQLAQASFISLENMGHFDVIHPDSPAFNAIVSALNSFEE